MIVSGRNILNPVDRQYAGYTIKKDVGTLTIASLAVAGGVAIAKKTKGKNLKFNKAINKSLNSFVNSTKKFPGSEVFKKVAGKLAKTTGTQKLIGAMVLGCLGAAFALREHYSKKQGALVQASKDAANFSTVKKAYESCMFKKNDKINELKMENELKDVEIKSLYNTIDKIDKAADKLGVNDKLAAELNN